MASEMGHVEVVRALLDAGATVNEAEVRRRRGCDLCGSSPLAGRARTRFIVGVSVAAAWHSVAGDYVFVAVIARVWHASSDMLVGACGCVRACRARAGPHFMWRAMVGIQRLCGCCLTQGQS